MQNGLRFNNNDNNNNNNKIILINLLDHLRTGTNSNRQRCKKKSKKINKINIKTIVHVFLEEKDAPRKDAKPTNFISIILHMFLQSVYYPQNELRLHHEVHVSDIILTVNVRIRSMLLATCTFKKPCIVMYSYNKSRKDALFLNFISVENSTGLSKKMDGI